MASCQSTNVWKSIKFDDQFKILQAMTGMQEKLGNQPLTFSYMAALWK